MPEIKRLAYRLIHGGVLLGLMLGGILAAGCAEDPTDKLTPQQAIFKTEMLRLIQQEIKVFMPLLDQPNPGPKIQANIDRQFTDALQQGKPLDHDLAVLDASATILAWRSPDPDDLAKTYQGFIGQNYSKFTKLNPVFKDDKIASFEVYTQYGPGLGLCAPMRQGNQLKGVLCLGFDEDSLNKLRGITKQQLLDINFNQ
ncbi:MAG: hypothetical protein KKC30_16460 [Proteobacteria bacterium]|nr:hypothetical protein [Pseudomonadota bacterium]MBU4384254.1 hypothetical protein [Pseudomonadota bacterium]MCG2766713.1 hypothetical protein [Desulfarculaceae bacterium]